MKKNFYLIMLFLGLIGFKNGDTRTITGFVYNKQDGMPLPGASVKAAGAKAGVFADAKGHYSITLKKAETILTVSMLGFENYQAKIGKADKIDVYLLPSSKQLEEVVVVGYGVQRKRDITGSISTVPQGRVAGVQTTKHRRRHELYTSPRENNSESYKQISENKFQNPKKSPLSTFAIDVDAASYSNIRRFINSGQIPPKDAVRIEEMINYFQYDLKGPAKDEPVAIHTELSYAPWNQKHQLLRIGLKAREIEKAKLPSSNLVFLIDVSGSMSSDNRLPLVKTSLKMLVDELRENDHVAIVTYAGAAGLELESTSGDQKAKIKNAIESLGAGGSTAGGAGIKLAYATARDNFIKGGNNRIILATDGDFNVGASSDSDMETLIEKERDSGINISVLGFGMGNLKDSKMETIADKGRGNYAYIDNISEARKAMITEFGSTLFTIAKDVKVQIEFNPATVQAYRLVGYENRLLESEDFNNDKKVGGDMGVGHTVTALYEIIPEGVKSTFSDQVDPLKYQKPTERLTVHNSSEIATIKFRYKHPESNKSKLQQVVLQNGPISLANSSEDFRFASAVAELGFLLRDSDFKEQSDYDNLISRAKGARGKDEHGYRAEFIRMAESAKLLSKNADLALTK
ncbi:MAG TPA: von Willebrand factor type A domain-containing protein [Pedobacter sp.]|jgi:Ca-activated chloride channel family protein